MDDEKLPLNPSDLAFSPLTSEKHE